METATRLDAARASLSRGGPAEVHGAIQDLRLLVSEVHNASNPAHADAAAAHFKPPGERADELQALLHDLEGLEAAGGRAECQRVLETVEKFVERWTKRIDHR